MTKLEAAALHTRNACAAFARVLDRHNLLLEGVAEAKAAGVPDGFGKELDDALKAALEEEEMKLCPTCNKPMGLQRDEMDATEVGCTRWITQEQHLTSAMNLFTWHFDSILNEINAAIPKEVKPLIWKIEVRCKLNKVIPFRSSHEPKD